MRKYDMDESSAYLATLTDKQRRDLSKACLIDMVQHMERAGIVVAARVAAVQDAARDSIADMLKRFTQAGICPPESVEPMLEAMDESTARPPSAENVWWEALRATERKETPDA